MHRSQTYLYIFVNVPRSCLPVVHGLHGRLRDTGEISTAEYTWHRSRHRGIVHFRQVPLVHLDRGHSMLHCLYHHVNVIRERRKIYVSDYSPSAYQMDRTIPNRRLRLQSPPLTRMFALHPLSTRLLRSVRFCKIRFQRSSCCAEQRVSVIGKV